jgi:hypothetical protein
VLVGRRIAGGDLFPDRADPVKGWRRIAYLWKSQLPTEGWNGLVHTLAVHRGWEGDRRVLHVELDPDGAPPPGDLYWSYDIPPGAGARRSPSRWRHYSYDDLRRHNHFMCEKPDDTLMHALEPFGGDLDPAVGTLYSVSPERAASPAHALIALWLAADASQEELVRCYDECLTMVRRGPASTDTAAVAAHGRFCDLVFRRLADDLSRLPPDWLEETLGRFDDQLVSQAHSAPGYVNAVARLIRHAINLQAASPHPPAHMLAHLEIERVADLLEGLGRGGHTRTGEDEHWLLALTGSAQSTIDATSLSSVDDGFWISEIGERYLLCQEDAVRRGVRIRRVFVPHDEEAAASEEFRAVCRRQVGLGIEVRVLLPADVPREAGMLTDFVVFDGDLSYEVTPSLQPVTWSPRPAIAKTGILRGDEAGRNADLFRVLWRAAEPFA